MVSRMRVCRSQLQGDIVASPSKSHTLRAILFATLADGDSCISNYLPSPDADAMIHACRELGATITVSDSNLVIRGCAGKLKTPSNIIDAGNSGQVLRFVAALSALTPNYTVITGDHSVRTNRPIVPLLSALEQGGAFAASSKNDGFAPIIVKGPLKNTDFEMDGLYSQPVSALLLATAFIEGPSTIQVNNPGEIPWVGLTLSWFDRLNIPYENSDYKKFTIPGGAKISGFNFTVPGDFSSVAYPVVAAVITNSEITIENLDMQDAQGDKALITALQKMGANITVANNTLTVHKGGKLNGLDLDISDYIDAVTILAVVGCYAKGTMRIRGAETARGKECNRLAVITAELKKMGADISETDDGLIVQHSKLHGVAVESHDDHRIAMSLAVAAMAAEGDTVIHNSACIKKSYPSFINDMKKLGVNMELSHE